MKNIFLGCLLFLNFNLSAQDKVDFTGLDKKEETTVSVTENVLAVSCPTGNLDTGKTIN